MTSKPFPEAVRELLEERDMSQRELARRTQAKNDGFPHLSTLGAVLNDNFVVTPRVIEAVAKGFNLSPDYFAEYRLAAVRDSLDPTLVGLPKALRTLEKLSS